MASGGDSDSAVDNVNSESEVQFKKLPKSCEDKDGSHAHGLAGAGDTAGGEREDIFYDLFKEKYCFAKCTLDCDQ